MTSKVYTERTGTQEAILYLDRHGDLYQMPETRAELVRRLNFQRRLTAHLASVIVAIGRSREVQQ
jgi:hypothetical protein